MSLIPATVTPVYSVGEIQVSYKTNNNPKLPPITSSRDAFNIFRQYWSDQINWIEEFYMLCLNRANAVVGIYRVSVGGTAGTCVDPKVVFQVALGSHASSIILAHNHPSGNTVVSTADKTLTQRFKEVGKLLDLPVLDHLILTPDTDIYTSFADTGIL